MKNTLKSKFVKHLPAWANSLLKKHEMKKYTTPVHEEIQWHIAPGECNSHTGYIFATREEALQSPAPDWVDSYFVSGREGLVGPGAILVQKHHINRTGLFYPGGTIMTLEELQALKRDSSFTTPDVKGLDHCILLLSIGHEERVVRTRHNYFRFLEENDAVC